MKTPLLLASALLLGACTSSNPDYSSHWNAGHVGESAEYAFSGYSADSGVSRSEYQRGNAESIALTIRRHAMNDNPHNPLQYRRGWGNLDNPYNMTAGIVDAGNIVRDGVMGFGYVAGNGAMMAVDTLVGLPAGLVGLDYPGLSSLWAGDNEEPTEPADFTTKNY